MIGSDSYNDTLWINSCLMFHILIMLVLNIAFYQTWSLHLFTRDRPAYMHNLLNKYDVGVDNKVNDNNI